MLRSLLALVADLVLVVLFAALGLATHGAPLAVSTVLLVAWPFAVGTLLGHLAVRSWNAPLRLWPHGVMVWAITLAGGMALRSLLGMGTQLAFVLTTAIILALLLLGWRLVAALLGRRRRAGGDEPLVHSEPAGRDEPTGRDAPATAEAGREA